MQLKAKYLNASWNGTTNFVQQFVSPSLQAIREGMVWLIPCLMVSSLTLFIASMGEFYYGYQPTWVETLYRFQTTISSFFPLLITTTISYVLAMRWRLPRAPVILLSILYLVALTSLLPTEKTVLTFNIVFAIITPLYAVPLLGYFSRLKPLHLTQTESAGQLVKESLNLVVPAIIVTALTLALNYSILSVLTAIPWINFIEFDYANKPLQFGLTFSALNSFLWFLGVHGYYALLPLVDLLSESVTLNYATVAAGGIGVYHLNLSFMGSFVFIGGSGSTLSLVLAILLFSENKNLKLLAIASIPIGMVNLNEILLFGLPIIFNPRLFLSFLLAPIVNVVISYAAISSGIVSSPWVSVPFNAPILFNAWIATGGDISAVLLQLTNILIGLMIYYPAVRLLNHQYSRTHIDFSTLDTTYSRRQEEASNLQNDPVGLSFQKEKETQLLEQHIEQLSHQEFCLEYQPQISSETQAMIGCEALIRARDEHNNLIPPFQFLPWLEKASLMKDVDLWVFRQVIKDIERMRHAGVSVPVSINVTPETLLDEQYVSEIEQVIGPFASLIHMEITEKTLLADEQHLASVFNRLQSLGVKIYIDDFGTGYSSLGYLNQYPIDAIKIDRSFVLALATEKGQKVMSGTLAIAEELELNVVVEGIETEEQLSHVPCKPTASVQGWYYSKSIDVDCLIRYAKNLNNH